MVCTAHKEFSVIDGDGKRISDGEIRYTFNVTPGRKAVTWANAAGGFSPAEDATAHLLTVEIRTHQDHPWRNMEGAAFDAFSADVSDEWLLSQLEAEAAE